MYNQPGFSDGLHILRGLAAVSIVFLHAALIHPPIETGVLQASIYHLGAGVTLFFILSGFSLAHSNIKRVDDPGWIRSYGRKRFMRIAPVFWLFIAIHVVWQKTYLGIPHSWQEILLNVTTLFVYLPGKHESIVWAGWTIGVEVAFYMMFPILLAAFRSWPPWLILTAMATVISLFFRDLQVPEWGSWGHTGFLRNLFVFFLGVLMFFICQRVRSRERPWIRWLFLGIAGVLFVLWGGFLDEVMKVIDHHVFKAIALTFLTAGLYGGKSRLMTRFTRFLGDTSFVIYLGHPIVIMHTRGLNAPLSAVMIPELAYLVYCVVVLLILFPFCWIVHRYYEAPFYNWALKKRPARTPDASETAAAPNTFAAETQKDGR